MSNMFVKPWSEESLRVLKQLSRFNGRAFSFKSEISRNFGKKYPKLFDNGFLDTAKTRYNRRKDKIIFVTPPGVQVIEKITPKGQRSFHFKRFELP